MKIEVFIDFKKFKKKKLSKIWKNLRLNLNMFSFDIWRVIGGDFVNGMEKIEFGRYRR